MCLMLCELQVFYFNIESFIFTVIELRGGGINFVLMTKAAVLNYCCLH